MEASGIVPANKETEAQSIVLGEYLGHLAPERLYLMVFRSYLGWNEGCLWEALCL